MTTGVTLDTGALIALESGSRRMAVLVEEALASGSEVVIPAGVVAQAWRGSPSPDRAAAASVSHADRRAGSAASPADRIGARCAATGVTDVIDISVALCARDRDHAVVTSDPGDIRAPDPSLTVLSPA